MTTTIGAKLTEAEMKAVIALSIEQSKHHLELAEAQGVTQEEKRAHMQVVRALDKAIEQMTEGNFPHYAEEGVYTVRSRTTGGTSYLVDLKTQRCNCQNGRDCWHLAACNTTDQVRTMQPDKHIEMSSVPETGELAVDEEDNDLDGLGVFIDEVELKRSSTEVEQVWSVHKERGSFIATSEKGDRWVKCSRVEMAITIAALMNRDKDTLLPDDGYLKTNGEIIMLRDTGEVIGIASDKDTADKVDTLWFVLWIPF